MPGLPQVLVVADELPGPLANPPDVLTREPLSKILRVENPIPWVDCPPPLCIP